MGLWLGRDGAGGTPAPGIALETIDRLQSCQGIRAWLCPVFQGVALEGGGPTNRESAMYLKFGPNGATEAPPWRATRVPGLPFP
ncbi:hypothetical protein KH5H1_11210 [Corallococcus caeni]|nr:hypothetical protein KH5H1_11210 [Corallococcus sp. KH5-1]